MRLGFLIMCLLAASASHATFALEPSLQSGTVMAAAERLKAGEYLWAPEIAPRGPARPSSSPPIRSPAVVPARR